MATNYVATAYPSTLVKYAAVGQFFGDLKKQLLTVKGSVLELQEIIDDELSDAKRVQLPCMLSGLWAFRPNKSQKDYIFVLTKNYDALVLEIASPTKTALSLSSKICGRYPCNPDLIFLESGPLFTFHPEQKLVCLTLYSQRFEIIKIGPDCKTFDAFPIRVENVDLRGILSMAFLYPNSADLSFVILQGTNKGRSLIFSGFSLQKKAKDISDVVFSKLDVEADFLINLPFPRSNPGVLVIGNGCAQFFNKGKEYCSVASPFLHEITVTACCKLFEEPMFASYLVAGGDGRLVLLACRYNSEWKDSIKPVCTIKVELLGVTAAVQALAILGHGVVFLGACSGPASIVIKLRQTVHPETKQYFDIVSSYPALGSVLDLFVMRNSQKQGLDQSCLLACTADTFGDSLTIIRSGIKLEDPTVVELSGIEKSWIIKYPAMDAARPVFILSSLSQTRCFVLQGEDLQLAEIPTGETLSGDYRTLLCAAVVEAHSFLQVTSKQIVLRDLNGATWRHEWEAPERQQLFCARLSNETLCVAHGRSIELFYLEKEKLKCSGCHASANEVSALDVFTDRSSHQFCAVGEWVSCNLYILSIPDFTVVYTMTSLSETQPHDLCFFDFGDQSCYLFCGFGDGNVNYFLFDYTDPQKITDCKKLALGTRCFSFVAFRQHDSKNLFVTSDRPVVISHRNGKLSFASVNIADVVDVCQVDFGGEESLMVVTRNALQFGQLEDIQKIHLIPLHLGFQAFMFAFQSESSLVAVIGDRRESRINKFILGKKPVRDEERVLYILDRNSFDEIDRHRVADQSEIMCCICSWHPSSVQIPFFIMGTEKNRKGTIYVFQMIERHLQILHTYSTENAVRNVAAFDSWLLATGDSEVILYEWLPTGHQLEPRAKYDTGASVIYSLDVLNKIVTVADIQKSVTALRFDESTMTFELVGRDYSGYMFQTIALYDEDSVIGADDYGNIIVLSRNVPEGTATDLDKQQQLMHQIACINVGDAVTAIHRGYLTSESVPDSSVTVLNSCIFGTCRGQLGVVLQLEKDLFALLKYIESQLLSRQKQFGKLSQAESQSFTTKLREGAHEGFVNGDLLETFLDMKSTDMEKIVCDFEGVIGKEERKVKPADVIKFLDDLIRLH